ncbi:MAG: phage major capsid protein [FCB group bacterium]|nr:phage major capsid protein [FCB group bacterium]
MRNITQLRDDKQALLTELGDMKAKCIAENRDPSADERKLANSHLAEIDEIDELIETEKRTQAAHDKAKQSDGEADKTPVDTRKEVKAQEKRDSFLSLGEQLQAVMRAGAPGGSVDQRLSNRAATGLSEAVPSDGGFLVQSDMAAGILKTVWNENPILSRVSKVTLSGNKTGMKFNGLDETDRSDGSRAGGIRGYWKDEAAQKTASKPKFRQIELSLNKLIGLCYATDELLDDAAALEATIREGFAAEFNFKLVDAIINGTGAGQPLGIINSGCMVSVAAEAGQSANTLLFENVNNMWSRLIASSRTNAVWCINQDVEPQLHTMSVAVGTGGVPVYMPAGGASATPYSTLFGRPVIPIEQCPILGDTGDIILGDFSQYKAIDKGGMQSDASIHVRFIYDESVFRFVYRFDGQPVLASSITPYTAGATTATADLSHFIKMAAR